MENTCFAILSGGKNSRIGCNKAFLEINGEPIINNILRIANKFPQKMIITNEFKAYEHFGLDMFRDFHQNRGPIGGIHSALIHSNFDNVFIISCDMPFITQKTIQIILDNHRNSFISLPIVGDKIHFVCGVYSKKIFKRLDDYLLKGMTLPSEKNRYFALYQLEKMFEINLIEINKFMIDEQEFININTMDDCQRIR
jgi:molybdopterin-guanine dinucleotide biosynthesis protein A